MISRTSRTELLIGKAAIDKLKNSRVAVFGIGGVGGYVAEALARSGVGTLTLIDNDTVSLTNINRQILALTSTVGRYKTEAARERIADINPEIKVNTYNMFFTPDNSSELDLTGYDYIVDAIDTVSGKIELVLKAERENVKIISSMGTGNKLDASRFEVADIYETSVCPLARVMRYELKKRGVRGLKVVYSKEEVLKPALSSEKAEGRRQIPGSMPYVPPVCGLIIAGEVIKDIISDL